MHERPVARNRRSVALCLLLVLAIQSLVPVGYMPKAFAEDSGFIQLCPQGISDQVMEILHPDHNFGHAEHISLVETQLHPVLPVESHHGHHQMHQQHHQMHSAEHHQPAPLEHHQMPHADTEHGESNAHHASGWQNDCPYGLIASSTDFTLDVGFALNLEYMTGHKVAQLQSREIFARHQRKQQPRAPPHSQIV